MPRYTGCCFIPPFVVENMARKGVKAIQLASKIERASREKRAGKRVGLAQVAGAAAPTGDGLRLVYDCQHKWEQRVKLIRQESGPATNDDDEKNAYKFAGEVREYLARVLNRKSIDGAGMNLVLNIHYGEKYMNAFWDGDEMTFGDGDGEIFSSFSRSLDVVAHELAHGITQHTANLEYKGQPGALNESFSDVFGSAITQAVNGQTAKQADWLIGDEIMGPQLYGEALRSLEAPGTAYDNALMGKDPQPDHMSKYYAGPADNQGVHINSGIPNKAFYLAARHLGTDVALKIWYQALQNLWPTADFAAAADVLAESARVLVKTGEVTPGAPQAVRAAFRAVGL